MKKSNSTDDRSAFQRAWNASGLPAVIIVDNAMAHHSEAFKALAARLNVSIRYQPMSRSAGPNSTTPTRTTQTPSKPTATRTDKVVEVDHTPIDVNLLD
jgi:hypothetical protein